MNYDTDYAYLFIKWCGYFLFAVVAIKFFTILAPYIR